MIPAELDPGAVVALRQQLEPILHGQPPVIVGAALADLVSMWLAGHVVWGDDAETRRRRDKLLGDFVHLVRELLPLNARMILARAAAQMPTAGSA